MSPARAHLASFIVLAALVGAELALAHAHLARGPTLVALGALALVGFAGVVGLHMNLRAEPRALKLLFVLPLVYPVLFAVAVVAEAFHRGLRP